MENNEPLIKVEKSGEDFKMIDCEVESNNRPAFETKARNTQLLRTKLKSTGLNESGKSRKWFSMDNPIVNFVVAIVVNLANSLMGKK